MTPTIHIEYHQATAMDHVRAKAYCYALAWADGIVRITPRKEDVFVARIGRVALPVAFVVVDCPIVMRGTPKSILDDIAQVAVPALIAQGLAYEGKWGDTVAQDFNARWSRTIETWEGEPGDCQPMNLAR
jgi:hypothetical protein